MDKYRIRRTILEAVEAMEPGVCTLDDVAQYPLLRMAAIRSENILAEVRGLVEREYLLDGRPGREPLLRLTAKGRGQIHQEEDLEEFVWGDMASKFQR